MIEKLKLKDVKEAAKVYNKGLQMEIPKGYNTLDKTIKHLKEIITFVYKENQKIKGLVSFKLENQKIKLDFICVTILRKGIGKKLMKNLAIFAIKNKINFIYSRVSSKDKRVINFYETCGFKRYSKYFADKNFMLYRIKAKPEWIEKAIKKCNGKDKLYRNHKRLFLDIV